jgi:hypothetical protein
MANIYDYGIYNGIDFNYDYKDKDVNIKNNIAYMLNRSLQMFDYTGLPETIVENELERILQTKGYGVITEVGGKLYSLYGGFGGELDVYDNYTTVMINNNYLNFNETLTLNKDCILIKNDDMRIGLIPLFSKYCTILAENEITMVLNTISKRHNNIMTASDDSTAESARTYIKKLENGELGVIMDNKLYDSFKVNPLNEGNSRANDLIDFHQYIKATMYNEIGLKDNINMKKERLIEDELNSNNDIIFPLVDSMLNSRKVALEKINLKYGTDISIELGSSWKKRELEFTEPEIESEIEPDVIEVANVINDTVDEITVKTDDLTNDDVVEVLDDVVDEIGAIDDDIN